MALGKRMLAALVVAGSAVLAGCTAVYAPPAVILTHYANDHVVPEVLSSGDVDMSSCGSGTSINQLMSSFQHDIKRPHLVLMGTEMLSAYCAEARANEAHLMFLQSLHDGESDHARDYHVLEQRLQQLTAKRRFAAYQDFLAAYPAFTSGHCPHFSNDLDQAEFMSGLLTSVQALLSDIQAGGVVGVPQDVVNQAARASTCLDNEKWWGMPEAIRAAGWLSVPGTAPAGVDPQAAMDHALTVAAHAGMPLPATFAAIIAYSRGDGAREEAAIRAFVAIDQQNRVPKPYLLFAEIGRVEALQYSDQIWMQATGARTPYEGMGRFPDDAASHPSDDTSNLLN
jgi:hypothetical protein